MQHYISRFFHSFKELGRYKDMVDMFSPEKRSEIMSSIRSKDTVAEKYVFSYLRKHKIYYQKHYAKAPGKPDVALPRKKKAIFIDGDFWHGRDLEKTINRLPKVYWRDKILRNVERDKFTRKSLIDNGWKVLQVWEKDINRKRTREAEFEKIINFLTSD
jgi:DNA mismatch endonuclease (patch repair protein)